MGNRSYSGMPISPQEIAIYSLSVRAPDTSAISTTVHRLIVTFCLLMCCFDRLLRKRVPMLWVFYLLVWEPMVLAGCWKCRRQVRRRLLKINVPASCGECRVKRFAWVACNMLWISIMLRMNCSSRYGLRVKKRSDRSFLNSVNPTSAGYSVTAVLSGDVGNGRGHSKQQSSHQSVAGTADNSSRGCRCISLDWLAGSSFGR